MTAFVKAAVEALRKSNAATDIRALWSIRKTIKGRDVVVGDVIICPGTHKACMIAEIDGEIARTDSDLKWNQFYLGRNDTIEVYRP